MARAEPVDLGSLESPDLALVEAVPWVVAIEWQGGLEQVVLVRGEERQSVWSGARAWGPRIAVSEGGEVWLAWCGRAEEAGLATDIHLMRVGGELRRVSVGGERSCQPDLVLDGQGRPQMAWEEDRRVATWSEERGVELHSEAWLAVDPRCCGSRAVSGWPGTRSWS